MGDTAVTHSHGAIKLQEHRAVGTQTYWEIQLLHTAMGLYSCRNIELLEHRPIGRYSCYTQLWGYTAAGTQSCWNTDLLGYSCYSHGAIQLQEHRAVGTQTYWAIQLLHTAMGLYSCRNTEWGDTAVETHNYGAMLLLEHRKTELYSCGNIQKWGYTAV